MLIISTRSIRWILWFSGCYATACREIFSVNALITKFAYLHWEVSFSDTEISLIPKNKMAAPGISLKSIYHFYWLVLIRRRLNFFIGDMYVRSTCPLQACRHLTLKLFIQDLPRSAKVPHVADFKMPIFPLLLVLEVWQVQPTYRKSWAGNLLMWSDLTLDPPSR